MLQLSGNLKVFPNPWGVNPMDIGNDRVDPKTCMCTLDRDGRPCGVVFFDIHNHQMAFGHVGAVVDKARTKVIQSLQRGDDERSARQRTVWSYLGICAESPTLATDLPKQPPVEVPPSSYYIKQVQQGSLLPADEATARKCSVKFVPPATLMPELEKYAHASFNENYGPGVDAIKHYREQIELEKASDAARAGKPRPPAAPSKPAATGGGQGSNPKGDK